jgi:hypothetical protein
MNDQGRNALIRDLKKLSLPAAAINYDQHFFGAVFEGRIHCCLGGLALIRQIGLPAFKQEVEDRNCYPLALKAGIDLLGTRTPTWTHLRAPCIFSSPSNWPTRLADAYRTANAADRCLIAIRALRLADDNGDFPGHAGGSISPFIWATHALPMFGEPFAGTSTASWLGSSGTRNTGAGDGNRDRDRDRDRDRIGLV